MDFLDLIIIGLIFTNIVLGYRFGLLRRLIGVLGLFAGVGAATLTSAHTSEQVASTLGWTSALFSHAVTYLAMVIGTVALFELLGGVYQRHLTSLVASFFDGVTGILAGGILGTMEVVVGLIIMVSVVNAKLPPGYAYPPAVVTVQEQFLGSALGPRLYTLEPLTRAIFSWVLPEDISGYFTQLLNK